MIKADLVKKDHQQTLHEHDWDFSAVPDAELATACLWEYSRESPTMTEAAFQEWICRERSKVKTGRSDLTAEEANAWLEQLVDLEFDSQQSAGYEAFLEAFYTCDHGFDGAYELVKRYGGESAEPWLSLAPEDRSHIAGRFGKFQSFRPLSFAINRDLGKLWRHHEAVWDGENIDDDDNWTAWEASSPIRGEQDHGDSGPRETIAALTIDFHRFTDAEIVRAFADWLTEHRPKDCPEPNRRGRKTRDLRAALERLGLMRLLHNYSPGEIRHRLPAAWKLYGNKAESFRREVNAAVKTFHRLLPFVPATEHPKSYLRKGVRTRNGK